MPRRAHEVTRIEGFSDAVFGFALTLLVVQLEVPRTPEAFDALVRGSVPFAVTFAMVCYIWWEHNQFFRRYGLQDAWTAFLNSVLLFVVLFYVYPLKFLATAILSPLVGGVRLMTGGWDARFVMQTYSIGVALIFGTFVLLYWHAWSRRKTLELDASDLISLRFKRRAHLISTTLGLMSIAIASVIGERLMWVPGVLYGLMGPLHGVNGWQAGRAQALLAEQTRVQSPHDQPGSHSNAEA